MDNKLDGMDDKFVLMDLKNGKDVASAIQSETATKILDYLTTKEKGATESEISKDLSIKLTTVHYNIKQLKKAKLVIADEFHYSKKGKEVMHYKLAKKLIIIAPGETSVWKDMLKKIIPAVAIVGVASLFIKQYMKVPEIAEKGTMLREMAVPQAMDMAQTVQAESVSTVASSPAWIYFLVGAGVVLITFIITELILRRK